jgi:hypothetical protein
MIDRGEDGSDPHIVVDVQTDPGTEVGYESASVGSTDRVLGAASINFASGEQGEPENDNPYGYQTDLGTASVKQRNFLKRFPGASPDILSKISEAEAMAVIERVVAQYLATAGEGGLITRNVNLLLDYLRGAEWDVLQRTYFLTPNSMKPLLGQVSARLARFLAGTAGATPVANRPIIARGAVATASKPTANPVTVDDSASTVAAKEQQEPEREPAPCPEYTGTAGELVDQINIFCANRPELRASAPAVLRRLLLPELHPDDTEVPERDDRIIVSYRFLRTELDGILSSLPQGSPERIFGRALTSKDRWHVISARLVARELREGMHAGLFAKIDSSDIDSSLIGLATNLLSAINNPLPKQAAAVSEGV